MALKVSLLFFLILLFFVGIEERYFFFLLYMGIGKKYFFLLNMGIGKEYFFTLYGNGKEVFLIWEQQRSTFSTFYGDRKVRVKGGDRARE